MFFLRRGIATLALSIVGFGAGAAFTSTASAQTITAPQLPGINRELRGERGSRYNIRTVERRTRRMIAQLNHDQRDYGGHRANAVRLMQQAEGELQQAVQYDAAHPNQ